MSFFLLFNMEKYCKTQSCTVLQNGGGILSCTYVFTRYLGNIHQAILRKETLKRFKKAVVPLNTVSFD